MQPGDQKKAPENPIPPETRNPIEAKIEEALDEFSLAWCGDNPPDPDEFCERHADCGPGLRERIEDFLYVAGASHPSESSAEDFRQGVAETELAAGKILGDFVILEEIGRGGMGVVYEARQQSLNRRVALKVLPPHLSWSQGAVLKFRREAEAGSRQNHPHLVAVYAVGEHEGIHFIAQELVEGGSSLADRLKSLRDQTDPPAGYYRNVAKLSAKIARALHHAHTSGVIHRDIKPSNILLTNDGQPKVSDFGLARVEDALALSRSGHLAGTPFYMSPEQAESRRSGIDHRTDIYSLGVTLYEMLTETVPFDGETSHEVLKKILTAEPRNPRQIKPHVPRDLAVICLKAMEKVPAHRYATMGDFADDLTRFIDGRPIMAQPAGAVTRAFKRIRRNPAFSAAAGVAALAILTLMIVTPGLLYQAIQERNTAVENSKKYETQKLLTGFSRAREYKDIDSGLGLALILEGIDKLDRNKVDPEVQLKIDDELVLVLSACHECREIRADHILHATLSPNGKIIAAASIDGTVAILDAESGDRCLTSNGQPLILNGHTAAVNKVAFSNDGSRIATASNDYTACVWDSATGERITECRHGGVVVTAEFNSEGSQIVTASSDMTVRIWDADTGRKIQCYDGHTGPAITASFHPNGNAIISSSSTGSVKIWNVHDTSDYWTYKHKTPPICTDFNHDGSLILSLSESGILAIKDYETRATIHSIPNIEPYSFASFSRRGNILLTATRSENVTINVFELWKDPGENALVPWILSTKAELKGHKGSIVVASISDDAEKIISLASDKKIKVWNTTVEGPYQRPRTYEGRIPKDVSQDGTKAVTLSYDSNMDFLIKVWGNKGGELIRSFTVKKDSYSDLYRYIKFSPSGDKVAIVTSAGNQRIHICNIDSPPNTEPLHIEQEFGIGDIYKIDFNADSTRIVAPYQNIGAAVFDTLTGERLFQIPQKGGVSTASYNYPVTDRIATYSPRFGVRLWDAETGEEIQGSLTKNATDYNGFQFSPDGTKLITFTKQSHRLVWDSVNAEYLPSCKEMEFVHVVFSPTMEHCALFNIDGSIVIGDQDLKEKMRFEGTVNQVYSASFTFDGKKLVALIEEDNNSNRIYLWDVSTGKCEKQRRFLKSEGNSLSISYDNEWAMLSSGNAGNPILWPLNDLIPFARSKKPRELTLQERQDFFLLSAEEDNIIDYIKQRFDEKRENPVSCYQIKRELHVDNKVPDKYKYLIDPIYEMRRLDPWSLNNQAWFFVAKPFEEETFEIRCKGALAYAEQICELETDNMVFQQTLGIAQYRNGFHEAACKTFSPFLSDSGIHKSCPDTVGGFLTPTVFSAMAHYHLGNIEKAQDLLDDSKAIMRDSWARRFPVYQGFIAEAEIMIKGTLNIKSEPEKKPHLWDQLKDELDLLAFYTWDNNTKRVRRFQLYDTTGPGKAITLFDYQSQGPKSVLYSLLHDASLLCIAEITDQKAQVFKCRLNDDLTLSEKTLIYTTSKREVSGLCWHPDGKLIYIIHTENREGAMFRELCCINPESGPNQEPSVMLGPIPKYLTSPKCSSDGSEMIFCMATYINFNLSREIWSAQLNDSGTAIYNLKQLTANWLADVKPSYWANDAFIFWGVTSSNFHGTTDESSSIWRMNRDGSDKRLYYLLQPLGPDRPFSISSNEILACCDDSVNPMSINLISTDGRILTTLNPEHLGIEASIMYLNFIKRR